MKLKLGLPVGSDEGSADADGVCESKGVELEASDKVGSLDTEGPDKGAKLGAQMGEVLGAELRDAVGSSAVINDEIPFFTSVLSSLGSPLGITLGMTLRTVGLLQPISSMSCHDAEATSRSPKR